MTLTKDELNEARTQFRTATAPALVSQLGLGELAAWSGKGSARFGYFSSQSHFVVVAGAQEETGIDLALAYGLSAQSPGQQLVLVVPTGRALPTLQRVPWLRADAQPLVYLHDGAVPQPSKPRTRADTIRELSARIKGKMTVGQELRAAMTPAHLGTRGDAVEAIVEWTTHHELLAPSHRRGERSWQCMGQRVLSIKSTTKGIAVRAGIHDEQLRKQPTLEISDDESVTPKQFETVRNAVAYGIRARLQGEYFKPDEHWLQAVIRRDPSIVGVEQPALREVPAWRPSASEESWGRGFIDLLGLDGRGDVRVVETKLAKNSDDLLILQGLDYFVWATAYGDVLRERLGASNQSEIVVHYVVGALPDGHVHLSTHARRHAAVLDIPHRFQVVKQWFTEPERSAATSNLLAPGEVPG